MIAKLLESMIVSYLPLKPLPLSFQASSPALSCMTTRHPGIPRFSSPIRVLSLPIFTLPFKMGTSDQRPTTPDALISGARPLAAESSEPLPMFFQPKFLAFSVCHPIQDDQFINRTPRHAISSAIANSTEAANFMLLPCWGGRMSTNPFSKLLYAYPHLCCTLGTISSSDLNYANPSFWVSRGSLLPHHSWNMHIGCATE